MAGLDFISGAVGDIFSGMEKSKGMHITADGTRINATGLRLKAHGDIVAGENYDLASNLATRNSDYTKISTNIKQMQADRQIYMGMGATTADVAGAGFTQSGSALDLLRSSAQQGALTKQVIGSQGLITEAGYDEQATAYGKLAESSRYAAKVENEMATETDSIANKQDDLANDMETHGWITGGIKMGLGIAGLFG